MNFISHPRAASFRGVGKLLDWCQQELDITAGVGS